MRHHSCLLATAEAADDLTKAHSVGEKDTKRKNGLVSKDFLQECRALSPNKPKNIFQQKERR